MAKAGRKRSYEAYVRQYKAKQKKLAANKVQMNERMYSKAEFNAQYNRILSKRKRDVALGDRKTTGNITRDLIDRQAFALTAKQAEAVVNNKLSYYQKRSGMFIADAYNEKLEELEMLYSGDTSKARSEASKYISTEFFGSP